MTKFLYGTNTKTEHRRSVSRSCKAHYDPLKSIGEMKENTEVNFCPRRSHIVDIGHSSHAWRRQVLVSCDVCLCLCCLLLSQVVAVSGPFRPVSSSAPVVSGGAVAAERSPPVCEGELCGVSSPSVRLGGSRPFLSPQPLSPSIIGVPYCKLTPQ